MLFIVLPDIAIEDQLLSRAQQDNTAALREIYTTYFPPVFRYIRLRVANIQEAEDLTGDVFLKLITAFRGKNPPKQSLRGWLFRVARNVMYDYYSKKKKFTETALEDWIPASDSLDPEVQFIRSMSAERARVAILQLKFDQQEVVILRFGHMLSLQETAAIMSKSISSIKSLQFRALNNLRRSLEGMRSNG
ncbi:MAG: sigma-70 family RNA polymerase sigma factor [Anaerolineae bacterium]|nr:sigma-70 family RNA polymerase sigma factor [Anaerolineae bacterium]